MFKFKTKWYNDWKYMRGIKDKFKQQHKVTRPKQYILQGNPEIREFFYWMKKQDLSLMEKDIIELREMFYKRNDDNDNLNVQMDLVRKKILKAFKKG